MTETPDIAPQSDNQEPTDEQLRSDEARRYRQRLREVENDNVQLLMQSTEREERLKAVERQLVTQQISIASTTTNCFGQKPISTIYATRMASSI